VEADPTSALRRTVQLTGTAADIQKAFGVALEQKMIDGAQYRVREGVIHLPASLSGMVEAVLGWITALRHGRTFASISLAPSRSPSSYTPLQVAEAYNFPASASGAGQTIGIIELGGGYRQADLAALLQDPRPRRSGDHRGQRGRRKEQAVDGQRRGRRGDAGR